MDKFRDSIDVITLWDVIEHVPNPSQLILDCNSLLRSGGVLYIRTPNADGLLLKKRFLFQLFLNIYWNLVYPAMPYEHIYHFQPGVIKKIIEDNGLKLILCNDIKFSRKTFIGSNLIEKICRNLAGKMANQLDMPYEIEYYSEKITAK